MHTMWLYIEQKQSKCGSGCGLVYHSTLYETFSSKQLMRCFNDCLICVASCSCSLLWSSNSEALKQGNCDDCTVGVKWYWTKSICFSEKLEVTRFIWTFRAFAVILVWSEVELLTALRSLLAVAVAINYYTLKVRYKFVLVKGRFF